MIEIKREKFKDFEDKNLNQSKYKSKRRNMKKN